MDLAALFRVVKRAFPGAGPSSPCSGGREGGGAWVIAKKDMRIYYFKPPVLMSGVLTPVFMFLSFMVRRHLSLLISFPV